MTNLEQTGSVRKRTQPGAERGGPRVELGLQHTRAVRRGAGHQLPQQFTSLIYLQLLPRYNSTTKAAFASAPDLLTDLLTDVLTRPAIPQP